MASEQLFDNVDDSMKLTLPTGEVLYDTAIIPGFCDTMGIDVQKLWSNVNELQNHSVDEAIQIKNRKHKEVFYSKELAAGTAIIVGMAANARVKHGVPAISDQDHLSGSIVGRCIDTVIPWDDIKKRLEQQEKQIINKKRKTME
jgi:phosphopentomutase